MTDDLERIILSEEDVKEKVRAAAGWLDGRFKGVQTPPLAVCVLKGAALFFCDLVRAMETPVQLDFLAVSSYGDGTESAGEIKIVCDVSAPVRGRDVILIEDIVDSGLTLFKLRGLFLGRGAKSFTSVTLLDKPSRRTTAISADYSCCEIGDDFVVGYGLDYAQKYRDLPCVGVLKREIYRK